MACSAQEIVDLTPSLNGIPLGLIPYAQLALLCKIANDMSCDPTTLLENAKCLECSIPPGLVQYASLALLCSINAGGGGGVGGLTFTQADSDPPLDGSITTQGYKNTTSGVKFINLAWPVTAAPQWEQI